MKSNGHASRSWRRRLFAVAATAMLALGVAAPTAALAENAGGLVDRAPEHSKTIQNNGDGTYDLTLSVTGDGEQSSTSTPVDVVFVVDVSTSMNDKVDGWRGKSRMQAAHDAAATLANSLLTGENANKQIQVSVVTFGTNAQVATTGFTSTGFTSDPSVVANAVPTAAEEDQGTNWEDGLNLANAQTSGREGAEKHIVFLSDGNPTYRVSAGDYTETDEGGIFDWKIYPRVDSKVNDNLYGLGGSDPKDRNYAAAKDAANNRNGANLFVVSVAKGADQMQRFASETSGTFLDGTTADNLASAFTQIGQVITKTAGYKDVKIVDQLTQWVEGTGANGSIEKVRYAKNDAAWNDAPPATINDKGDNLIWDLSKLGTLEKGVTYSVTFTIRPSAQALADVAAAGVEKTFPTNVNASSYVEYKTVQTQTGQGDIVSDAKQANFKVPEIKLAAPAPVKYDISDDISIIKTLKGRDINEGEFEFELVEGNQPIATAFNDDRGGVDFGELTYQTTGQHEYTIREVNNGLPGVTYDDRTFQFTVNVVADAQGQLVVEPVDKQAFTFENTFTPATVDLTATKVLKGADLSADQFTFELVNNNEVIAHATNDANGNVAFRELTLKQEGTYTFTMREVAGNVEGMTYDNAEYTVKVSVKDDNGQLVASVEGNNPTFTNSYTAPAAKPSEPEQPAKQLPQTGDTNNATLPIVFAVAAVVCIAAGVTVSRKRK